MSVRIVGYDEGRWELDIRVRLPNGAKHREKKIFAGSKTRAKRWGEQRELHLVLNGANATKKEVPTLSEFKDRFLNDYARANQQKPSGISNKEIALRIHLLPVLGSKRLNEITTADVQRLKGVMSGRSPKTVNNSLTVLSKLLKVAVEWGVIDQMPCSVKLLKSGDRPMHFWDFDQLHRLVNAATSLGTDAVVAVLLGAEAGLRAGEMRALEWTDIDFVARQLTVARADWQGQIGTTKGNRVRVVPMTARLSQALKNHRTLRSTRVLCDPNGKPLTANGLAYLIERSTRRAGLASRKGKGAGPHVLRHTFCSHLAMRGAPVRVIQALAGHRDLSTTLRYMHLSPGAADTAIRLLEQPAPHGNWGAEREAAAAQTAN